ncbi:hypothetical protein Tco_1383774 [Tanacetum coccineum]
MIFVKSLADNLDLSSTVSDKSKLSEAEDSTLSNHSAETQKNTIDPSIAVTESSMTNYDSADESFVYSTQLLPLKKLDDTKLVSGPKIVKSILKSKSTFKAETLKGIKINEPSSARTRGNKSPLASKTNSSPARKIISLRRGIKPINPEHITNNCETCGSNVHTTSDHNDIEWSRKRGAPQDKRAESFKANKTESSSALRSKTPTKSSKIKQSERGISINKERYVNDLLKIYDKIGSSVNTSIMPSNMLEPDLKGITINEPQFKSMIGSQTSQASSRPDI